MRRSKSFKDLQDQWYRKLEEQGFQDIETTSLGSRPLKEWHNHKFRSQRFQIIRASRSQYQRMVDNFINHPSFIDACRSVISHGNCRFTIEEVQVIWEMHSEGMTRRKTAERLKRSKGRIDGIIGKLREWMKLI